MPGVSDLIYAGAELLSSVAAAALAALALVQGNQLRQGMLPAYGWRRNTLASNDRYDRTGEPRVLRIPDAE